MFKNLFGITKEQGTQLYFRDDGGFHFRKLDIEDGHLIERTNQGEALKAWLMRYNLLEPFEGYRNISADMVTMSFGRDIIYDPFNKMSDAEKPEQGDQLRKDFVKKIAEAKCYKHELQAKGSLFIDKLVIFLGATMVLLAIAMGLKAAL